MLIKLLGIGALFAVSLPTGAWALVPIEGLLQGQARDELQYDPLALVFQGPGEGGEGGRSLHKRYIAHANEAQALKLSCDHIGEAQYPSSAEEERARRTVVATLQYVGLDLTVKAIGQYARLLQMNAADYGKLADNLVASSCSPNLSVYGLKLIRQNLDLSFTRTDLAVPSFPAPPYAPRVLTEKTGSLPNKERELHHTLQNFRALCSWGGDTQNYRMLPPLLANPLVMITVIRQLEGKALEWDEKSNSAKLVERPHVAPVLCRGLLCRTSTPGAFLREFPRLVGSSGVKQDLYRMWCNHFRYQEIQQTERQHPQVRAWLKKLTPELERMMVGQLVSLITGVPDLVVAAYGTQDLNEDLRASIDERWDDWAKKALAIFSRDMLYEESLQIKVNPRREIAQLRSESFRIELNVTMGELDRLIDTRDKLRLSMDLKLSRSWLRWVRSEWTTVNQKADPLVMEAFMERVAEYLKVQVDAKAKFFPTPLFKGGLEQVLAQELVEQVLRYQGPLFASLEDGMVSVPVSFNYGMFALSYMRYKADLKARYRTLDL